MKQGHLDDLRDVKNREELLAAFMRAGKTLGFPLGGIGFRSGPLEGSPAFTGVNNAPPAWVHRSNDPELAMTDPVFQRLNSTREPFVYDADFYFRNDAGPLWDVCASYGYKYGVAASLHISPSRAIFWGFDTDEKLPADESARMHLMASIQLVGVFGSMAIERVLGPERPLLTERQKAILQYARSGQSSWVISTLMQISPETVNYHLKKIRAILGVRTRVQAIDKATALGLLD